MFSSLVFLANVNSSSRSLYVIGRPSVVCLSSVTFVRPTQAIEIFGNISTPVVPWPSMTLTFDFEVCGLHCIENYRNCCHLMSDFKAKKAPNLISAGAATQIPLGELV